ncbi:MAG TPA: hypothetical protein VN881_09545 [Candidatus Acidoferrales bacterium]|nr:hypothetical protein [Candidatus Acidoferrales bacterium]
MNGHAKNAVGSQEKIDRQHFIRLAGSKPLLSQPKFKTNYDPDLFSAAFGPPEVNHRKRSCILFWNFVYPDGKAAFSLFANFPTGKKAKDVSVFLSAHRAFATACNWTEDRLSAVEHGDEEPLLLGAGRFVVSRVC